MRIDIDFGQDNEEIIDLITAVNLGRMPMRRTSFARIYGTIIVVVGIILTVIFRMKLYMIIGLIFILLGALEIYSASDKVRTKQLKRTIKKGFDRSAYTGKRSYEFTDEGLSVTSDKGTASYGWDVAEGWGDYGSYIFLITKDNQLLIIDIRQISDDQAEDLRTLYREKIG